MSSARVDGHAVVAGREKGQFEDDSNEGNVGSKQARNFVVPNLGERTLVPREENRSHIGGRFRCGVSCSCCSQLLENSIRPQRNEGTGWDGEK